MSASTKSGSTDKSEAQINWTAFKTKLQGCIIAASVAAAAEAAKVKTTTASAAAPDNDMMELM
jgi:hypothetical protein